MSEAARKEASDTATYVYPALAGAVRVAALDSRCGYEELYKRLQDRRSGKKLRRKCNPDGGRANFIGRGSLIDLSSF